MDVILKSKMQVQQISFVMYGIVGNRIKIIVQICRIAIGRKIDLFIEMMDNVIFLVINYQLYL
jgi:hypothetical protein